MMDSARVRTVGSSSTTRTVFGLACFDVIRITLVGLQKRQTWGKSEVPTLAVILQFRFHLLRLCSRNSDSGSSDRLKIVAVCYRDQADRPHRLAREQTHHETKALLTRIVSWAILFVTT